MFSFNPWKEASAAKAREQRAVHRSVELQAKLLELQTKLRELEAILAEIQRPTPAESVARMHEE